MQPTRAIKDVPAASEVFVLQTFVAAAMATWGKISKSC